MTEETTKKKYELTFWLKDENASPVKKVLGKHGVEVIAERDLAKFRLSYPIKKESNAFMGSIVFALDPALVSALTGDLNLALGVLRFIVTLAEERSASAVAISPDMGGGVAAGAARERGGFFRRLRTESKPAPDVLTNEALEKKIEEISK